MRRVGDGARERLRDEEMERWGDGEMGRWGDGEMGRRGERERGRRRDGESGRVGGEAINEFSNGLLGGKFAAKQPMPTMNVNRGARLWVPFPVLP